MTAAPISQIEICIGCGCHGYCVDDFLSGNGKCEKCNAGHEPKNPEADRSAAILTAKILAKESFFFVRFGDGALECMAGRKGLTRDMEHYSDSLGAQLADCWRALMKRPDLVYVGDWQAASFDENSEYSRYAEQYEAMFGDAKPRRIHFEALLLMRNSPELLGFYRAVRRDSRRKLFMGPQWNAGAAKMLRAEHLVTPTHDLLSHTERLLGELRGRKFDVLLYGAGMAGNVPAIRSWEEHPERTYINLGSAMDVLFFRRTRNQQLSTRDARKMFAGLL